MSVDRNRDGDVAATPDVQARLQAILDDLPEVAGVEVGRLADALSWPVDCDAAALSHLVMSRASAQLQARARRIWQRQIAVAAGLALVTLPVALVTGGLTLRFAYDVLCNWIPTSVATYLLWSYATVALGMVGATYAMIPVAIGRSRDRIAFAQSWEATR